MNLASISNIQGTLIHLRDNRRTVEGNGPGIDLSVEDNIVKNRREEAPKMAAKPYDPTLKALVETEPASWPSLLGQPKGRTK